MHIVDHVMADFDTLSSLVERIFMSMNLRQDGTVLQFKLANNINLPHSVGDRLLLKIDEIHWQMLKGMLNTLSALLEELHLLITKSHIMEHDK